MRVRRFYDPEAYKIDNKSLSNCKRLLQQVFSLPEQHELAHSTGWLRIKYPTRQYAISPQPVV